MPRPRVPIAVLVVVTLLLVTIAPLTLGANSNYDISIDGSIDTADRTTTTSYGEFTITEVGRVGAGESVTVSVDAPSDTDYSITIVDGDQRIRRIQSATGDATTTFDTEGLGTGTYAVSVGNQSTDEVYQVEPLVVKAYDVTVDSDTTVEEDSTLDVTVELDQVESGEPVRDVQVALTADSMDARAAATKVNDTTYTATIPTDKFTPGDYSLYAVVRSDDTALGENELVGVSDETSIDVTKQSTDSSDGSSSTGGSSSGSSDSGSADTTETDPSTKTATDSTETPTETSTTTTATTTTETPTTTQSTKTDTTTAAKTTTDNVVTPNEQTTTPASTTSSELPNTGLQALFGLLVVFGAGRRIARN